MNEDNKNLTRNNFGYLLAQCNPPIPKIVVKEAKRLRRKNPRVGKRRSLCRVANELAKMRYVSTSGKPFGAESIKRMVIS